MKTVREMEEATKTPTTAQTKETIGSSMRPIKSMVAKKSFRPTKIAEKGMKATRKVRQNISAN